MTVSGISLTALSQALKRADQAAEGIRKAAEPATPTASDRVGLSTQAVALLAAKNGYDAALELAKTADEVEAHAINLLG